MKVANYLKRASSCEDSSTYKESEEEVHNNKKAREVERVVPQRASRRTRTSTNKNKLTVTFSTKNDVFEISRLNQREKNDVHMSKEDQNLILREILDAMRSFDSSSEQQQQQGMIYGNVDCRNDNDYDIKELGLERILEQQNSDRLERVKSAICVILQRQRQSQLQLQSQSQSQLLKSFSTTPREKENQTQTININELWLKKHYRPFSELSAKLARSRGLRDQEMAPSLIPRKIVMSR